MACALVVFSQAIAQADAPLGTVYVDGEPVAPPPKDPSGTLLRGTGLCGAFRLADANDPNLGALVPVRPSDFPVSGVDTLVGVLNDFMDSIGIVRGDPTDGTVHYETLLTSFDLAGKATKVNDNNTGDYSNTSECSGYSTSGCRFPGAGSNLDTDFPPFVSRFRGFILIPDGMEKIPFHIGFFTKMEVAMRVYQKPEQGQANAKFYDVINRATKGGLGTFRATNTISFRKPGLYPVEIVHATVGPAPALEMVAQTSNPDTLDIDDELTRTPSLSSLGYSLFFTTADRFFQTSSGVLPFGGQPAQCQQCPRKYANQKNQPMGICPGGFFCNEAAVCSPCVGDQFCGKSCKPCDETTPYCVPDSASGGADSICVQCREDPDCKVPGQKCIAGRCVSPCLCCPGAQYCVPTDPKQPTARNCSECRTDSDCGDRKCDLLNGHCVDKVPDCNTDDRCGTTCGDCSAMSNGVRPHCMDGKVCVQCRFDVDCASKPGTYCRSGDCVPCTHDRHCGPSCLGCGTDLSVAPDGTTIVSTTSDKAFCIAPNGQAQGATCVRCLTNEHCGPGGECNPVTHECNNPCTVTCAAGQICNGSVCQQCLTSSQCPCGQCIGGVCTENCGDSTDCRSNQCCTQESSTCTNGRCKPGLTAHGGGLCCSTAGGTVGAASDPVEAMPRSQPLWALVAALAFLAVARQQSLRAGARRILGLPLAARAASGQSSSSQDRK